MDIDINKIHHNYLIKLVISSIIILKQYRFDEGDFNIKVNTFIEKRTPFRIDLKISVGPNEDLLTNRRNSIRNLINGDIDIKKNLIVASFKTPLESVNIQIDLKELDKYNNFLNS